MRTIYIDENVPYLDYGGFATVWRLSPRRVVKVYEFDSYETGLKLARDEITGSKKWKGALPVLEMVDVVFKMNRGPRGTTTKKVGLIKRYIPKRSTSKDVRRLFGGRSPSSWDSYPKNYRIDSLGRVYRVDTQTSRAEYIAEHRSYYPNGAS